jgi:hypothetical protein
MKFYTFGCDCGCSDPLIMRDIDTGEEAISIFRTKEAAQLEASEYQPAMRIVECEVQIV